MLPEHYYADHEKVAENVVEHTLDVHTLVVGARVVEEKGQEPRAHSDDDGDEVVPVERKEGVICMVVRLS